MSDNAKLRKEATDLLNSSAHMPSYASNLISRLQKALEDSEIESGKNRLFGIGMQNLANAKTDLKWMTNSRDFWKARASERAAEITRLDVKLAAMQDAPQEPTTPDESAARDERIEAVVGHLFRDASPYSYNEGSSRAYNDGVDEAATIYDEKLQDALARVGELHRDKLSLIRQLNSAVHKMAKDRSALRETFEEQSGIRHPLDMD